MDSASLLAGSLIRAHSRQRKRGMYKGEGRDEGGKWRLGASMFTLLGFITTVSLAANTCCMMDGLALGYLAW